MSERRMFSKSVIDSDEFLTLPLTAQALYFHISMRADDDGFINNPKIIQRMIGASANDIASLIENGFVIPFESGIIAIRHWMLHNRIRSDRKKSTLYQDEYATLFLNESGIYESY